MGAKDKELELKIRKKIYNYILKNPGIHERMLSRVLDIPLSTLDYHLYFLKKRELITSKSDGHYTLYYVSGKVANKDKKIFKVLRQKTKRKIIIFILLQKFCTHKEICNEIKMAGSTITFHLKKLIQLGIIDKKEIGRETIFTIHEPDYLSDLIITYKKSFLDDSIDSFVDTWLELHPRHLSKKKK